VFHFTTISHECFRPFGPTGRFVDPAGLFAAEASADELGTDPRLFMAGRERMTAEERSQSRSKEANTWRPRALPELIVLGVGRRSEVVIAGKSTLP